MNCKQFLEILCQSLISNGVRYFVRREAECHLYLTVKKEMYIVINYFSSLDNPVRPTINSELTTICYTATSSYF